MFDFKKLFSLSKIFNFNEMYSPAPVSKLYFNGKPLKKHSILLWDLENIPFTKLEQIKKVMKYTPDKMFVITKQSLGDKKRNWIESNYFDILDKHNTISDIKLIRVLKLHSLYDNLTIISSDSDFVHTVKRYLGQGNFVHWILTDANKKRVIMNMDLANPRLKFSTL